MKNQALFKTIGLIGSLFLQLGVLCHAAPGDVDLSFDLGSGVNGTVYAVVVQPDGKAIIGGEFTTVKGLARTGIARLHADGSGDSSFNPGALPGGFYSMALQTDGKVLVGHYGGIQRLNSDGTLDATFSVSIPTIDEYDGVFSIAVQTDGKVLIAGNFYLVNGTNRNGMARLHANGSLDTGFDSGAGVFGVNSIALQPDGKVLIGGGFSSVNGTNRNSIARLNANGSLDSSFDPGLNSGSFLSDLALQGDGRVLIGGVFSSVNGTNRNNIACLNANGSLDSSFDPGTGTTHPVDALALQYDGRVLISGAFVAVNGTNRSGIARLNTNGSLDGSFNPDTGTNGGSVLCALQPDGKVLLAGQFTSVNGANRNHMARLNADGSRDGRFDPGSLSIDSGVLTGALQPDGKLLIGGTFTTVGGLARTGLARLNPDGSVDGTFNSDIKFWATVSHIRSLALQPDGKVLATGIFAPTNGVPSASIARFNPDGSWDPSFQPDLWPFVQPGDCLPGYGCWQSVEATSVLVLPDGKVLVGGHAWTTVYGDEWSYDVLRPFLGRFETNGSRDWSFTSGTNYSESCLARQPDGKILVGGAEGIARLNTNGTLDLSFNAGAIGSVRAIALQPDGKVVLGGGFFPIQGTNYSGVMRLNANGNLDGSFKPAPGASGTVYSIALQPDGKVLIGRGTTYDGTNYNTLSRRHPDGSLDASFKPGSAANAAIRAITLQPDGNILISGSFLTVNGVARPSVARLYGDAPWPTLNLTRSNASVLLSWPVTALNFQLQESTNLALPNAWSPVVQSTVTNGAHVSVTVPASAERKFFRLNSQ